MTNEHSQDEPSEVDASGSSHCSDADWDEYTSFDEESCCHYCSGEGWGIVGTDWDSDDGVNGPYPGDIEKCPCCGGSGKAEDCQFW